MADEDERAGAVTWLFVPGDRPERFDKAAATGADAVILDLEDAVVPGSKELARSQVASWLTPGGGAAGEAPGRRGWVRINAVGTPWYDDDVAALAVAPGLAGLVVPKAEDVGELVALRERLGRSIGIVALVESALGMHRAVEIAGVVDRLAFGSIDYAVDLGAEHTPTALLHARSTLVFASRVAGIEGPVDGVTAALRDEELLAEDVAAARELGFTGKLLIHPAQVAPVVRGFAPTPDEADWARHVLAAVQDGTAGAVSLDGAMVDKPVVDRARRILDRVPAAVPGAAPGDPSAGPGEPDAGPAAASGAEEDA